LTWGQNIELPRSNEFEIRLWYAGSALSNGWSRPVLAAQFDTAVHKCHGNATTNSKRALPPGLSDLAQQLLKDPYQFNVLTLTSATRGQNLERALTGRVRDLLLEFGKGFALVGSHHPLSIGGQDFM